MTAVTTANGTLPWDDPPERRSERGAGDTKIGLTVVNEGVFHAELALVVEVPGDSVVVHRIVLPAGQRGSIVISLSEETVEAVRTDADGMVRVKLVHTEHDEEPVTAVEVTLPAD